MHALRIESSDQEIKDMINNVDDDGQHFIYLFIYLFILTEGCILIPLLVWYGLYGFPSFSPKPGGIYFEKKSVDHEDFNLFVMVTRTILRVFSNPKL